MIDRLDHVVLTVRDLTATCDFYVRGLGLEVETAEDGRTALLFGRQKFNLHETDGTPVQPRAQAPTPGSGDFCLIADRPLGEVIELLGRRGIPIELGPVERRGALGPMRSIYLRDPDGNLVGIIAKRRLRLGTGRPQHRSCRREDGAWLLSAKSCIA